MATPEDHRVLLLFAELLAYPNGSLAAAARECESRLAPFDPEAARLAERFCSAVERMPLARLEELYTAAFDLNASWHPYVGYHLLGESYKRSAFLLELKERYRAQGFSFEGELPDHLAVGLQFVSGCADPSLAEEIVADAVVPALERMLRSVEEAGEKPEERSSAVEELASNPYRSVLEALRQVLRGRTEAEDRRPERAAPPLGAEMG
jgi:nitrate reductase delta subunit